MRIITGNRITTVLTASYFAFAYAGCVSIPAGNKGFLDFLARESISRSEVIAEIGEPSATFEQGRVLTYRLSRGKAGYYVNSGSSWEGVECDLVLVFDDENVLQQHNLVAIRPR